MHAVVIHKTGGPEVLRYEEVPDPEPGEGELLVRIEAAGVNHYDINLRAMMASHFPLILGSDGGGVREDSGERVLVTRASGSYAELVAVTEDKLWSIPDSVSASSAAALGVSYTTAWWALVDLGELKEGDTLLVQAGSSGTGQASIDIGRAFGATVYATAGESKLDRLRELGVEPFAYDDPKLSELGADVVFDPVGGEVSRGASRRWGKAAVSSSRAPWTVQRYRSTSGRSSASRPESSASETHPPHERRSTGSSR